MALGISITPLRAPSGALFKGRKVKAVKFTGDNAKPSAGYVVTAANLNLRLIEGVLMGQDGTNEIAWKMTIDTTASSTASTNQATLQAYSTSGSNGTASASHTLVSNNVVTALVYGF